MNSQKIKTLCVFAALFLAGCAGINSNPDLLLQAPYTKVKYIAEPTQKHKTVEVIQVQTRGLAANTLNTIPLLYKKALKYSRNKNVEIGNIKISSYTKRESFLVPYQSCSTLTYEDPKKKCSGFGETRQCYTTFKTEKKKYCTTLYKTEIRTVLYQVASADIFGR